MRETFEDKIGKLKYAVGLYEKLIRATIPITFSSNKNGRRFYLLISFDLDSDYGYIIERKILPIIKEHKEFFL